MSAAKRARQALTGLVLVSGACASTELSRHFEHGQYARTIEAFEADPALRFDEEALYMAGVAYAVSATEARDRERAEALLRRLLELYPETKFRGEAQRTLSFIRHQQELSTQLVALSTTLEELKAVDVGRSEAGATAETSRFNQFFQDGQYARVVNLFEADVTLRSSEHALFRAAVAYAMPDNPRHDPTRARELFGSLMNLYPNTPYRDDAEWFTALLNQEIDLRRQIGGLERELEELKAIDLGAWPDEGTG